MSAALIALATEIGAPLVRRVLTNQIGAGNARLAEEVVGAIAERAGILPNEIDDMISADPEIMRAAINDVEGQTPELIALYVAEAEAREAVLLAEIKAGGWQSYWRPGWMYLLGFLWLWQIVILHALNAVFKTALPVVPWEYLMGLSALVWGIYSGGHTVKEVAKTWRGGR